MRVSPNEEEEEEEEEKRRKRRRVIFCEDSFSSAQTRVCSNSHRNSPARAHGRFLSTTTTQHITTHINRNVDFMFALVKSLVFRVGQSSSSSSSSSTVTAAMAMSALGIVLLLLLLCLIFFFFCVLFFVSRHFPLSLTSLLLCSTPNALASAITVFRLSSSRIERRENVDDNDKDSRNVIFFLPCIRCRFFSYFEQQ